MMRLTSILLVIVCTSFAPRCSAQPVKEDAIGKQASRLEAELGRLKDTSAEAANTLVKLVDLYHADGRCFGLIPRRAEVRISSCQRSSSRRCDAQVD